MRHSRRNILSGTTASVSTAIRSRRRRQALGQIVFYAFVSGVTVAFLFPLIWMLLASFKTQIQNTAIPPLFIFEPTLENFRRIFIRIPTYQYVLNSLLVGLGSTLLGMLLGLPAAFCIARYRQNKLALAILTARILPGISYLIPWFLLFSRLRMVGTYQVLILAHLTVTMPLIIWVMIGFFEDVPDEIEDAARIDGCTVYSVFYRIALPLVRPGVIAAAILAFIFSWNNFMFALVLGGSRMRTLPVAVYDFISYTTIDWGGLNATATTVTLPVLILTLLVQRGITKGLTMGGLKG